MESNCAPFMHSSPGNLWAGERNDPRMRTRTLSSALPLGLLLALGAQANPPSFDGMTTTERTTYERTSVHRVFEVDTERFDAEATRALELLDQAMDLYGQIYVLGRFMYDSDNELNSSVIRFNDPEKKAETYDKAAGIARELQTLTAEIEPLVRRLVGFFGDDPIEDQKTYSELLDRHAKMVHVVTLYEHLRLMGVWRSLDFDTWRWGDEEDAWVLDPGRVERIPFPKVPRISYSAIQAQSSRQQVGVTGTGDGSIPVVMDQYQATVVRTTLQRSVDPKQVDEVLRKALEHCKAAQVAYQKIAPNNDSGSWLYFDDEASYHAAKPQALAVGEHLARAMALRNEATSLVLGSDLLEASRDIRASYDQLAQALDDVVTLDDQPLRYDPFGPTDFKYRFPTTAVWFNDTMPPLPQAPKPAPIMPDGSIRPGHGLSFQTVYNSYKSLSCERKVPYIRENIHLIYDLTEQNIQTLQNHLRNECSDWRLENLQTVIRDHLGY